MKLNTTDFRRKMQHPLLLAFGSIPLALILILNAAPELLRRMWIFPAAYVLLAWGCILIPGKRRILGGAVSAALLLAMGLTLLPVPEKLALILLPVMYIALIIVTLPIGGWPRARELAVGWHVAGVGTHVALQVLLSGSQRIGTGLYDAAQIPLLASFLCYAVLVLLALNRSSLESASQSRRTVPLLMRRQNIVITLALLVIGVAIAAIPAIGSTMDVLWNLLMRGVAYVAGLIAALLPSGNGPIGAPAESGDVSMGFGEAAPPSELALILEKVLGVVALVVVVVSLILLVRVAGKKLIQLLKYLWGRLGQYSAAAGEDYEDEITSTRDEPDVEREGLFARLRRFAPAEGKGLTPTERVRSRYRRMKRRHPDWTSAQTARETLPPEAASLYERARYSGQSLTEDEANRFHERTKKV